MTFMSSFPSGLYDAHSEDDSVPSKQTTDERIAELEKRRLALHEELKRVAEKIGEINQRINKLRGTRRPE